MRVKTVIALSGILVATSSVAYAQDEERQEPVYVQQHADPWTAKRGVQLGVRVGYGLGVGEVYSGLNVMDAAYGSIPVIIDLGARVLHRLYIGVYGQVAPVITKTNAKSCPSGFDCNVQDWRVGIELDYHITPHAPLDWYLGFGGGYEILQSSASGTTSVPTPGGTMVPAKVDVHATDRGWEFGNVTVGFDARCGHFFGIGPFLTGTIASYNVHTGTQTVNVEGAPPMATPVADVNEAVHALFILGIRGTLNL